jgi:hypothetical protein
MEKVGRNDPCICGSGKKFKKCCEGKMIGKKFLATKIETSALPGRVNKAFSATSILSQNLPKEKPIEPEIKKELETTLELPKKEEEKLEKSQESSPSEPSNAKSKEKKVSSSKPKKRKTDI